MNEKMTAGGGVEYTHAGKEYFEKRGLQRHAGAAALWGLGVAAVISGDFSGWNFGIGQAGWGGMLIATIVVGGMYLLMIYSISERSAAMPHTGGAYSFARSAMGRWLLHRVRRDHRVRDHDGRRGYLRRSLCRCHPH